MSKLLKTAYCVVFFALVALPTFYFFGARESWTSVYGWENKADVPPFTFASFADGSFQSHFTERYSKQFFLRATFLRTAYQLREMSNFGLFHYGYGNSILEGRDGVLFERPYASYHLTCPRPGGKAKYADVLRVIGEMSDFCRSNGIDFVYLPMPDKLQAYPEYLPRWLNRFWDYSNYDSQAELSSYCREEGIPVFDVSRYLLERKAVWKEWVYPPGGTHFNAYGSGLIYKGFVETLVDTGKIDLKANRFLGVRRDKAIWSADDDIGELLNLWRNPHVMENPHYAPVFDCTNVVRNAGSLVTIGDCYREQLAKIFSEAGLFDPKKVLAAPRGTRQAPDSYKAVAGDLRLVLLTFQSFNTGRLDERQEELTAIFTAIREAYRNARREGRTVVVPPRATPVEKYAARELANALERVTGKAHAVTTVEPNEGIRYLVGGDPLGEAPWKPDEIRLLRKDDRIFLTGDPTRGPLYAVNEYLERFVGVRWWTKDASHYPSQPGFLPPLTMDVRYAPPFAFREALYLGSLTDAEFKVRMKGNTTSRTRYIIPPTTEDFVPPEMGGNHRLVFFRGRRSSFHSFEEVLPPSKHFSAHPEWYSYQVKFGRREAKGGQLCVTNGEMTREYIKETLRLLRENPDCDAIQVSQNDNGVPCECPCCRARAEKEGAWSGPYLEFVNRVAEAVEREFPHVMVDTFAYQFTRKAPKSVRPRKNVVVRLCDIECHFNRPLADAPDGWTENAKFIGDLADWSRVAAGRLYIWDYQANFSSYMLPHPNLHVFADNLSTFRKYGAVGVFEQGDALCPVGDFVALKQYVTSKLLWNPETDWNALTDEFLFGYYGSAAAQHLRRMLEIATASATRPDVKGMGCYHTEVKDWITPEAAQAALLELSLAHEAAARTPGPYLSRVRAAAMGWEHARILNWERWNQQGDRVEAIRRWKAALSEFKVDAYRETTTRQTLDRYLEGLH